MRLRFRPCWRVVLTCLVLWSSGSAWRVARAQVTETERVRILAGRGRAAYALGSYEKAFESFEEALELQPDLLQLREEYAQKLQSASFYERAEEQFRILLQKQPDRLLSHRQLVNLLLQTVQVEPAVNHLESIVERFPDDFWVLSTLAQLQFWTGNYERALPIFRKALHVDPDDKALRLQYFDCLSAAGDWGEFIPEAERYVERYLEDYEVKLRLADAYIFSGRFREARALLSELRHVSEQREAAVDSLVGIELTTGRQEAAMKMLVEEIEKMPDSPLLRGRLAVLFAFRGSYHKAFAQVEELRRLGAEQKLVETIHAELIILSGMPRTGLQEVLPVLANYPSDNRLRKAAAEACYSLGLHEAAINHLKRVLVSTPGDVHARLKLALNLHRLYRHDEMLRAVREVLQTWKQNPSAAVLYYVAAQGVAEEDLEVEGRDLLVELLAEGFGEDQDFDRNIPNDYLVLITSEIWGILFEKLPQNQAVARQLISALSREGRVEEISEVVRQMEPSLSEDETTKIVKLEALLAKGAARSPEEMDQVRELAAELTQVWPRERRQKARLARALQQAGRQEAALALCRELLEEEPDDPEIASRAISLLLRAQSSEGAQGVERDFLALEADNVASRLALWDKLADLGPLPEDPEFVRARAGLEGLSENPPDNVDVRFALSKQLVVHQEWSQGIALLEQMHDSDPKDLLLMLWLARALTWEGDYRRALSIYEELMAQPHWEIQLAREKARVLAWNLQHEEAVRAFERAQELDPADRSLNLEKEAKRKTWDRRYRKALRIYEQAVQLRPRDPEILFEIGQAYSQLGYSKTAEDYYKRTLLVTPGHSMAPDAIAFEEAQQAPSVKTEYRFRKQDGFDNDFEITEHALTLAITSAELEGRWRLGLESTESWFEFDDFNGSNAFTTRLWASKKFPRMGPKLKFWLQESFYTQNSHRNEGWGIHVTEIALTDELTGRVFYDREDVLENFNTIDQKIWRDRVGVGAAYSFGKRWDADVQAAFLHHSDDNNAFRADALLSYAIYLTPDAFLKLIYNIEQWNYHRGSVYFSPRDFTRQGLTLHWRHNLKRVKYRGSDSLYYGLKAGVKHDDSGVSYGVGGAEFLMDIGKRWTIGADLSFTDSRVYDDTFARVSVVRRF